MLTSKQIEFATLKEKPYKLADKDGLYLYITPQGGKYWRHNYRHDGKNKTLSYGVFPKVSLLEARQLHKETQDTLLLGADPML
ncbi:MAG TPA: Arm DNA-binding domain-containing protein, partial [Neisseria sp.]|nr:Arm DNA-binding domain-containing protein [Neisseria sp.]